MSIPTKEQAGRFLAPLKGNLAIVLLHEIQVKARLSSFLLRCAGLQSLDTTILDADAFYCTNMERFAGDAQSVDGKVLLLPEQGLRGELAVAPALLEAGDCSSSTT